VGDAEDGNRKEIKEKGGGSRGSDGVRNLKQKLVSGIS
jgi:hypothetical protein